MSDTLFSLKQHLDALEAGRLSSHAARSSDGIRRHGGERRDYRQAYSQDTDRILHSKAYTRYIDKTQVFSLVRNDHITHRVLHVQLVSKVARTTGRFLGLNEDLIEAIALGHDIGHPPFGHDGEQILAELCREQGLTGFAHNVQSVRFLDTIERGGRGWNLTLQTLDGILCHDGEAHDQALSPQTGKTFADLDREAAAKISTPETNLVPMTLEGCLVRFCDTISYIGRDIEDAIRLALIERQELPAQCRALLGDTNGTIVYRLVTDLIEQSRDQPRIRFSPEVAAALSALKQFNYERIYLHPLIKRHIGAIATAYRRLFSGYLASIEEGKSQDPICRDFLAGMDADYLEKTAPAAMVRDYLAGMTDDYFLTQAAALGCEIPLKKTAYEG